MGMTSGAMLVTTRPKLAYKNHNPDRIHHFPDALARDAVLELAS